MYRAFSGNMGTPCGGLLQQGVLDKHVLWKLRVARLGAAGLDFYVFGPEVSRP